MDVQKREISYILNYKGTDRYGNAWLESAKKMIPLQRLGTCEEVAHLVVFLCSEKAASFITGQTYYIGM